MSKPNQEFPEQPPRSSPYNPQHRILVEDSPLFVDKHQNRAGQSTHSARKKLFLNQTHPTVTSSSCSHRNWQTAKGSADLRTGNRKISAVGKWRQIFLLLASFFHRNSCPEKAALCYLQGAQLCQNNHLHLESSCSVCSLRATWKTFQLKYSIWRFISQRIHLHAGEGVHLEGSLDLPEPQGHCSDPGVTRCGGLITAARNPLWWPTWPWAFCFLVSLQRSVAQHCSLP